MYSVIIPAFNEASVIGRCLDNLAEGCRPGELEVLVVCNGCSDSTAEIARRYGGPVKVLETEIGSKIHALNLGDEAASGYPRIYLDADVVIDLASVRKIVEFLEKGPQIAAAPRPVTVFLPETSWSVRAFYRFWMELPYVQEGMIGAGAYALSEEGRKRFDRFPDVIADDGYVRLLFEPHERAQVPDALTYVSAPTTLGDLIKIKTRSRLGVLQLKRNFGRLAQRETRTKQYRFAILSTLLKPWLYLSAIPYLYVRCVSWMRARQQFRKLAQYVWARDDSSRAAIQAA